VSPMFLLLRVVCIQKVLSWYAKANWWVNCTLRYCSIVQLQIFLLFHSDKMRLKFNEEEQSFHKYCRDFPVNETTDHSEPFCKRHPPKTLLSTAGCQKWQCIHTDTHGTICNEKRFQQFRIHIFRKHVHQEKEEQYRESMPMNWCPWNY
jgi:hypothetical protein